MSQRDPAGRRRISVTQVLGELLLTVGAVILLFAFYESYWTNISSGRLQDEKSSALEEKWGGGEEGERVNPRQRLTPELGEAFARIHIPAFGSDFQFAVVEGTSDEDLLAGPGRYTESQMPGQAGNFAVAGHRVGKGAPFNDLGNLQVCDAIVVETQSEWITYRVLPIDVEGDARRAEAAGCLTPEQVERVSGGEYAGVQGRTITLPGDVEVINPVPGESAFAPTPELESLVTLTTCHPQFSNAERMIVHAMEVESTPKIAGEIPAVLLEEN